MSYYYDPALESELSYRRGALLHDADTDRLARQARLRSRAVRVARRLAGTPNAKSFTRAA
jgi:hypothetical protein